MKTRIFLTTLLLFSTLAIFTGSAKGKYAAIVTLNETATEESLFLENWMVNDCYWKCAEFNCFSRDYDSSAKLEEWMSDITGWEVAVLTPVTSENSLALEPWMTRKALWDVFPLMQAETESELVLEPWMINPENWSGKGACMAKANKYIGCIYSGKKTQFS